MAEIVLTQPDSDSIAQEHLPVVQQATSLVVTNKEQHERALFIFKSLKLAKKSIEQTYRTPKAEHRRKWLDVCSDEKNLLKPINEAVDRVSGIITQYEAEQRRIEEEKRRRAEEEQRKRDEEQRLAQAIQAEEQGDTQAAEAILEQPPVSVPVAVESERAKVEGVSERKNWSAEVTDKMALIRFVAANPNWDQLLLPAMPHLNKLATMQRENLNIPGVKAVSKTTRAVRT